MHIPTDIRQAMVMHATFEFPNEACGLLAADQAGDIRMCYSLTNADASSTSYTIDPIEHFRAMQHAARNGWELIAAFHSHPHGPAVPSETDRRLAFKSDWLYVIVGMVDSENPEVRAYRIRNGTATEESLFWIGRGT